MNFPTGDSGASNKRKPSSLGLPKKIPNFIGRVEVCEEILSLLTAEGDGNTCLITLVAPPGFGKTAVAINMGYIMLEKGKDVIYVSLRTVASVTLAAKNMLEAIGIPVGDTPVSQLKKLLTSLQRDMVLILDNAEDLQTGEEEEFNNFLEEIGQHARNLVTLITTRIPLSKLDFPFVADHIALKPLDEAESFAFLKSQAPDIPDQQARRFAWPRACGGIPLLLKLSKTVDPTDLHRKLQNCPHSFLKGKDPKVEELFLLIKVFDNHLQPEVKETLTYLAAFPKKFTRKEAKDVLFPSEDCLEFQILINNLESHSLVQRDGDNNAEAQYSLHPLIQAFCKACSDNACKGYNTAMRLFSWHYLSLLQQLNDDFITTNCKPAIDEYHRNEVNICHALAASTEDEDLKRSGLEVSTETVSFLAEVMNRDEFMSTYSKFQEVATKLPDKTLYGECLVSIGFQQVCYHGYKDAFRTGAKRYLQEAHDLLNQLQRDNTECLGLCKCKLGLCTVASGNTKEGISLIAQGIGIRKERLVRAEGSGKMERVLVAGGFCDLGSKYIIYK